MTQRAQLGIGTFRMTSRNPEHRDALELALHSGVTCVDTALSYMNHQAQDAASQAITSLPLAQRSEIAFITKLGYLQGDLRDQIRARAQEGRSLFLAHAINAYTDYSIAPAFLEEGITRTLERLPAGVLPHVLLQSPEILHQRSADAAEFQAQLVAACSFLSRQTKLGRIAGYGLSSQTLSDAIDADSHLSLAGLWEGLLATEGGTAGFRMIEFPFNLLESAPAHEPLFQGRTLLETAAEYGLTTISQRPFLAQGDHPMRLISRNTGSEAEIFARLKDALDLALGLEKSLPALTEPWAHRIRKNLESLMNHEKWRNIRAFEVEPQLSAYSGSHEHADYVASVHRLLDAMDDYASLSIPQDTRHWSELLDQIVPDLRAEETLQRKAMAVYRAIPGLDRVLVGMRRTSYVRELTAPPRVELSQDQALSVLREIALRTAPVAH